MSSSSSHNHFGENLDPDLEAEVPDLFQDDDDFLLNPNPVQVHVENNDVFLTIDTSEDADPDDAENEDNEQLGQQSTKTSPKGFPLPSDSNVTSRPKKSTTPRATKGNKRMSIQLQGLVKPPAPRPTPPAPPRVGGVHCIGHEVWEVYTGGSNLSSMHGATRPPCSYLNQRRPEKFDSKQALESSLEKGIDLKLPDDKATTSNVNLPDWFKHLGHALTQFGLDTVFRLPNDDFTDELYACDSWGKLKPDLLLQWEQRLTTGVIVPHTYLGKVAPGKFRLPVCPHDTKNLEYSGIFLLASLTKDHRQKIKKALGPCPSGLKVLAYIVKKRLRKLISRQRTLTESIAKMRLCDEDHEDVDQFNVKLTAICKEICQLGYAPPDLALTVAKTFVSSVSHFQTEIMTLVLKLEADYEAFTWEEVLESTEEWYTALSDYWTPAGKTSYLNNVAPSQDIVALKKQNESLQKAVNQLKLNASSSSSKTTGFCFDCGKEGVTKGHDGCPCPGERKFLPDKYKKQTANSQNDTSQHPSVEVKQENGKTFHYCAKCYNKTAKKFGVWRPITNRNVHKTAGHKAKSEVSAGSVSTNVVAVASPTPSEPQNEMILNLSRHLHISYEEAFNLCQKPEEEESSPDVPVCQPTNQPTVPSQTLSLLMDDITPLPADAEDCSVVEEHQDPLQHWMEHCGVTPQATNHVSEEPADDEISVATCASQDEPIPDQDDEPSNSSPALLKPFSVWFMMNNYVNPMWITQLITLFMFLLSIIPSPNNISLKLCILLTTLTWSGHTTKWARPLLWDLIQEGPQTYHQFCYPASFMLLSCVMLNLTFANQFCTSQYLEFTLHVILTNLGVLPLWPLFYRYLPGIMTVMGSIHSTYYNQKFRRYFLKSKQLSKSKAKHCSSKTTLKASRLTRLLLLSALARVSKIPSIHNGQSFNLRQSLRKHRTFHGTLDVKRVSNLDPVKDFLLNEFNDKYNLIKGVHTFIVDSGCGCSCSPDKKDFKSLKPLPKPIILKGVTGEQECTMGGMLSLKSINSKGDIVEIQTPGYYNPHQSVRLFSPQAHFHFVCKRKGVFMMSWAKAFLDIPGTGHVPIHIDDTTFMPLLTCFHDPDQVVNHLTNKCVTDEVNPLLSKKAKLLLKFHYKLGHLGFQHLKWLLRHIPLFGAQGVMAADPSTDVPKCSGCITGGMEKQPVKGNVRTQNPHRKGCLKREKLIPGALIFSDQFVSSVPGKYFNGKGQLCTTKGFHGGTIFYDASSAYISIHHQQTFTSHETLQSMLTFEREAAELGIEIQGYNTDNGVYTAKQIMNKLHENKQLLRLSGVGAHHQNGVAENAIKNISRKARIFMFHAALRWPEKFDKTLWPLAMSHAVYLHNHTPKMHDGLAPIEHWTRSKSTHTQLQNAHPFGCPAYVLNPTLQDGFKIPKFEPRSMQGVYVGPSPLHASTVGLILNTKTHRISPQFHVIYDDYFETVPHSAEEPPPNWDDLCIKGFSKVDMEINVDSNDHISDWNAPDPAPVEEREPPDLSPPFIPPTVDQREPSQASLPTAEQREPLFQDESSQSPSSTSQDTPASSPLRRSKRTRKPVERFKFDKAHGYNTIRAFTKAIVTTCSALAVSSNQFNHCYAFALAFDPTSGIVENPNSLAPDFFLRNPNLFKAGKKDADTPGMMEALSGPHREEFMEAMKQEILELESHGTWTVMKRADIPEKQQQDGTTVKPQILQSTWAFRIKRWPSGVMRKIKARFCVRGDLQTDVDVFDTYAPVASWQSIRMLTTTALQNNWLIQQVDFSNAFVHAPMNRDVYISLPQLFGDLNGVPSKELCLKLNKSLYGLREAPKLWHDFLAQGIKNAGFEPSKSDPGVFYGRGMAIAVYVDDVLFFGPNAAEMKQVVQDLKLAGFELKVEKATDQQSFDFLGIHIDRAINAEGVATIKMTQLGLIKKFLDTVGMADCKPKSVPCNQTPLGANANGPRHTEDWDYASAVGMLMYLAGNAYPEIQFAVHQCARFTHAPRHSHAMAVKKIAHYLKGVLDAQQGLTFKANQNLILDLYVDADFAGLWKYEDDQDPVCVKSRTGFVITLGGCPVHWCSKLQTEIALFTLEAEHIALVQAMRELIPMHWRFEDVVTFFNLLGPDLISVKSTIWEDANGCILLQ